MPKSAGDDNFDKLATVPSPVGLSFFEQLMAAPNSRIDPGPNEAARQAVMDALDLVDEGSRLVIELRYIWGHSHSEIAKIIGYSSKSSAHDKLKEAEKVLEVALLEQPAIRRLLGSNMKTWNEAARFELDRITTSLNAGYKFDSNLFGDYSRMMGDAVRSGADQDIVVWAWYTAIEAARFLDSQGMWNPRELQDILVSKQHDYGHENINAFGQIGVAVRLSDKIARYYNLARRDREAKNEPFIDCLKDMVGYGVISAMLASETFDLELKEDWR